MASAVEDKIHDFLHGIQLEQFYRQIVDQLHVTRLNHFAHVTERDLDDLGMSKPAQRRLFEALKKSRKKPLFGSFRRKKSKNKLIISDPEPDRPATPPTPPTSTSSSSSSSLTCVINETDLVLHEMLGTGAFGYVRKGEWTSEKNNKVDVAVKCLKISKDSAFLQLQLDFTKEANGMSRLDHPHIIRLYGVVLSTPIMLVTEIAPLGCLLNCLRNESPKFLISQLSEFVVQVASGMAYLESQHYIHRDLAARNLLLYAIDKVKIGDFGLMRPLGTEEDYYTMNPKGKVPFAWCPPESLKFRKFSHASDVWSFGITVMELFSYGEEPWPGLNCSQILQKVDQPYCERPLKPSHCPSKIYNIVSNHCWTHGPAQRPNFAALQNIIEQIRPQDVKAVRSFDSKSPQNLCFGEGDDVTLIEASHDASWWRGQNKRTGRVGMFPSELVDSGPSSVVGTSSPTIIRGGSFLKKSPQSPIKCTPGKLNCDCGEDHIYDFPFQINSPNATSPVETRSRTRSFESELTVSTESDSGYSSSVGKLSRSNSECSRRDLNSSYENCRETPAYEFMVPKVKTKPTRPVPIPDTQTRKEPPSSDPVSIPNKESEPKTVRQRMSDPNPTPQHGFSKGRVCDPLPRNKPSSDPVSIPNRESEPKTVRQHMSDPNPTPQHGFSKGRVCDPSPRDKPSSDPVSIPNKESEPNTVRQRMSDPNPTPQQGFSKGRVSDNSPRDQPSSDPVSIPNGESEPNTVRQRMSDPNPTPQQNFSKGRVSDPSPRDKPRSTGPFTLSRRVSAKRLKSFDIPVNNSDGTKCPLNVSSSREGGDIDSPPSLPSKRSSSLSRPNSRNRDRSTSPQRSPVQRSRSQISQQSPEGKSSTLPRRTFTRSCSSDGFASRSLKEAQDKLGSPPSPTKMSSVNNEESLGRSYSFGSSSQRGCDRAELYENHEYVPRSKSIGSKSLSYENHQMADKSGSQNYDNHKLSKSDNKSIPTSPFYENHEIGGDISINNQVLLSEKNGSGTLIPDTYDNHRLKREFIASNENHSKNSVSQSYEKMVLRQSYIEKGQDLTDIGKGTSRVKNVGYENFSIGSIKNTKVCYENFVMVEHSDVPEEIGAITNSLKCPSYENHGFEDLRIRAENELKKDLKVGNRAQEFSRSLPIAGNWDVVRESLDNKGSLVVKVEQYRTPRLRKTSSDGDLRDSNENKENSENKTENASGPVAPPRWKKKAKQEKKIRWSLDVTGELASVLSNRLHRNSMDNTKESVCVTDNGVSFVDHMDPIASSADSSTQPHTSPLQDRILQNSDISNTDNINQDTERQGTSGDVPPALPERKKDSLSRVLKDPTRIQDSSYENIDRPRQVPLPLEQGSSDSPPVTTTLPTEVDKSLVQSSNSESEEDSSASPQRPNVLCFENKLAAFSGMRSPQSPPSTDRVEQVREFVPALPPKEKSTPLSPSRRGTSKSSNYPRLSRDSSDTKLSFDDVQRYRPCPTKGSSNYEHPRMIESGSEEMPPPPLPKKLSKTAPDVPPRTDLACN